MNKDKQLLFDEIKGKVKENSSFIVLQYKDFSSVKTQDFRGKIHAIGADYEVLKKRIFIKTAKDLGYDLDEAQLEGHISVAFSNGDPTQLAQLVCSFNKENKCFDCSSVPIIKDVCLEQKTA